MEPLEPLKLAELRPPLNVTRVVNAAGLAALQDFFNRVAANGGIIGWDIETTPLKDYFWRRIRTIQFGNATEQYVIDLRAFCGNSGDALYKAQGNYGLNIPECLQPVINTIKPVLTSKQFLKVGVNLGFEYENFYWLLGIRAWNFFDCSMVEKCIWAGAHSMKDYGFYSMEDMMLRYFEVQIDKSLQESFNLEDELTDDQWLYAAFDTRTPIGLRQVQLLILQGHTYKSLTEKGSKAAKHLKHIDPIVTGDNLMEIAQIENDAIGAFQDMHVHGERLDRVRWMERVAKKKLELKDVIAKELDPIFLPICGSKHDTISDAEIEAAEAAWKAFNVIPDEEIKLAAEWRKAQKLSEQGEWVALASGQVLQPSPLVLFEAEHTTLVTQKNGTQKRELNAKLQRVQVKEEHKLICSDLKKKRTVIKNLAADCEGEALINYNSRTQILGVLNGIPGLKKVTDTEDETLEEYAEMKGADGKPKYPVMVAFRKYRSLSKEIGTYGEAWATQWTTKPCKDEGWLHPGDGRLHCIFNQYDAETGRSTSEKPNGQNLPQDKEVRSCFVADPPDESIRISKCCSVEAIDLGILAFGVDEHAYLCPACKQSCETGPEEYVIITADMSGAELRIIAEEADDPIWITAFARGEDVHSVGTEILYAEKWPILALPECAYFKPHTAETVAANPLRVLGEPQRQKCKCPEHNELRNDNKATNFLLAYGGGPQTLAVRIKKTVDTCKELMALHKSRFPKIWAYLDKSGKMAQLLKKSFDMFGRRRLFPEPTWERAKLKAREDREEKLRYPKAEAEQNKANFVALHNRKPNKEELWILTHREVTNKEQANAYKAMHGSIERQGKNHAIQGTNATIAKKAMGSGYCPEGKPYLWHVLPQYKAKLIKFVHDELVIQVPKRHAKTVADLIGDAFRRAAAEKMKKVVMEFEYSIAAYWKK